MRKNKYNARKVSVDGITFDSVAEARRYGELKMIEKAGGLMHLVLQPRYDIIMNGIKCGFYKADFQYWKIDLGPGGLNGSVVEDVKGMPTPMYRLKKKLVEAYYGITITEIKYK